jgi:hypothetical protein
VHDVDDSVVPGVVNGDLQKIMFKWRSLLDTEQPVLQSPAPWLLLKSGMPLVMSARSPRSDMRVTHFGGHLASLVHRKDLYLTGTALCFWFLRASPGNGSPIRMELWWHRRARGPSLCWMRCVIRSPIGVSVCLDG